MDSNTTKIITHGTAVDGLLRLVNVLLEENELLHKELERAYINSNFNCYNRNGAEVKGNRFLETERRRAESGELAMICFDVAGMGNRNQEIGELAVNEAIAAAIGEIKAWRGIEFFSQLNSGDEFVLLTDKVHTAGILDKLDVLFKTHGFEGIYGTVENVVDCYIESANKAMEKVYELKKKVKLQKCMA